MAKNIDFMGAVFPDVPSIRLPQQGGGLVSFDDTTDANATASDIAEGKTAYVNGAKLTGTASGGSANIQALSVTQNGTYTASGGVDGYSPVTVSVSGGGGGSVSPKQINFIDYDGTIVDSYTASEWANVTALPSNPSHTGLTAQGWNWTKAQIDAQLAALPNGDIWVGQMYITDDNKTRVYIHLEEGRLHPYLGICPNGTVVVDWGDNSATATLTGTSLTTVKHANHEYASGGDYVITITVSSGNFAFTGARNTSNILKKNTTTSSSIHRVYATAVKKIELGAGANVGTYAFYYCSALASITIPSSVTTIGTYAFRYCYALASITIPNSVTTIDSNTFDNCNSLASVTIPNSVTTIGNYAFQYCYALASITIPNSVTTIGNYAFYNCNSLASVTIPSAVTSIGEYAFSACGTVASITMSSGVTTIGASAFYNCNSLASVTIPNSVTTIGNSAFSACMGVSEYHILPLTTPALGTSVFASIQSECVIYVPSDALTTYKGATNWSTYASYMQGE